MAPRLVPAPSSLPIVKTDAAAAYAVLRAGGGIIAPTAVGYGLMTCSAAGLERAFATKPRRDGHTMGVMGTWARCTGPCTTCRRRASR